MKIKLTDFENFIYDFGILLFLVPVSTFLICTLAFAVGLSISPAILPIALFFALGFCTFYVSSSTNKIQRLTLLSACVLCCCTILIWISNFFFDISFDGQWYHQDAIIFLKEGWNPFYDPLLKHSMVSGSNADYVNHYAKAPWFSAAAFYSLFEKIQLTKCINGLFLLSSFLLAFFSLRRHMKLNIAYAFILSGLLAFSPLSFGQLHSFYVDGQLSSIMIITIVLIIDHLVHIKDKKKLLLLSFVFFYFVNIKFTGLVYGILLLAFAIVWVLITNRAGFVKILFSYFVLVLISTTLFGYPTYVRNTFEKKHPLYPILGPNSEGNRLAQVSYAHNFFGKNRFEKYYLSTFAIPKYYSPDNYYTELKPLFNIGMIRYGLGHYKNHQPTLLSPIGPLYGEFVILFIPYLLIIIYSNRFRLGYLYVLGACLISIIIFPEFWNYRYTPQLYFFYLLCLIVGVPAKQAFVKLYGLVLILLLSANLMLNHWKYWEHNYEQSLLIKKELKELSKHTLILRKGWMQSFEYRLKENNIRYSIEEPPDTLNTFVPFQADNFTKWAYRIKK